ncbi:hypothetical protein HaLaN_28816 [Haematococcus lacustris]|uniref:Uncharacterized protein n=1 Tax=Haematococcus lacustris TaxID=44745 RepID=A0A6A0ABU0_HAELA|nr:hypothetical protein HaLaN_28816 [Haematococcus lacustris]
MLNRVVLSMMVKKAGSFSQGPPFEPDQKYLLAATSSH